MSFQRWSYDRAAECICSTILSSCENDNSQMSPTCKKINLEEDVIQPSTTSPDRRLFKFVILGCVTFTLRLVFFGTEEVYPCRSCLYLHPESPGLAETQQQSWHRCQGQPQGCEPARSGAPSWHKFACRLALHGVTVMGANSLCPWLILLVHPAPQDDACVCLRFPPCRSSWYMISEMTNPDAS